jgi:phage-related protein
MNQDILNFAIKVVVDEKGKSKVLEYIDELYLKNPKLAFKSVTNIINLPYKILSKSDIKVIKTPAINLFELRIQSGSDICRFFFVIENPNIIVLYGFTKKTQNTDSKDINQGVTQYQEYLSNKLIIDFDKI